MKKQQLEILLQKVVPHPKPSASLEQYSTPAPIAADVLWFAYGLGDLAGKKVVDLGCGTGILGIGAKLLGAEEVIALDLDEAALGVAMKNAQTLNVDIGLLTVDVNDFPEAADTVLMNPPFGAQKSDLHADLPFLERALAVAPVAYTFHKADTEDFVLRKVADLGGEATHRKAYAFPIPHSMPFHTEEVREVPVVMLRIARKSGGQGGSPPARSRSGSASGERPGKV
ncbi:MAG TPA: METTL5 family protein [Thermoplasmata archaeon]|nr:METTL5 family protein [Thermoplasmata archaeon]